MESTNVPRLFRFRVSRFRSRQTRARSSRTRLTACRSGPWTRPRSTTFARMSSKVGVESLQICERAWRPSRRSRRRSREKDEPCWTGTPGTGCVFPFFPSSPCDVSADCCASSVLPILRPSSSIRLGRLEACLHPGTPLTGTRDSPDLPVQDGRPQLQLPQDGPRRYHGCDLAGPREHLARTPGASSAFLSALDFGGKVRVS